jgi:large repetitive protein
MRSRLGVGGGGVRSRARRSLRVGRWVMVLAAAGCAAVMVVVIDAPAALADALSQTFTTPGFFDLNAPQYAVRADITVQGASGSDGSASALGTNAGGAGGLGTVITGQVAVLGGEAMGGFIGAAGGSGGGAAGDGDGGRGGNGGQFSEFFGGGANPNGVDGFDLVAQGGGGGGGGGGAFFGQAGGNGGEGQFGLPGGGGNGGVGSGAGAGAGGLGAPVRAGCDAETFVAPPAAAPSGSDAGGGGGAGGGFCAGAGASGGTGGGGGGGGGAGSGQIVGPFQVQGVSLAAAPGDGLVRVDFTEGPTAPQITSAGSLSVMSSTGTVGFAVTGTGFPAPGFSLSGAPSWLSIDPVSGIASGTIPSGLVGVFTFSVIAADGTPPDASQQFTLTLTALPVTLVAPGTLKGNVSIPFSATLAARGGIGPFKWSSSGALPAGLSLTGAGQITGTATQTGTFTFMATASDGERPTPVSAGESVTMTIAPRRLTLTTATLPSAKIGATYSQALSAALGIAPLAWRLGSGRLPQGLILNARTGVISGVPTQLGTSSFTVKVTDATKPKAMTASASFSIIVGPNIQAAVYVTEGGYSAVQSFPLGSSGNVKPATSITGSATGLDATTAAVIDPVSGTLYIASAGNNEIAEYPYGATGNVAPSSVITGAATGLGYPLALALDSAGRLYVANLAAGSITVYATGAAGNAIPIAAISGTNTGLVSPTGLTFDRAGNLWVADAGTDRLTEFAAGANGDATPVATISGGSSGLNGPRGLTLDSAGNLLVANPSGDTVTEYPPGDNPNATPLRTINGLALPDGVDIDAQGNIYVANLLEGVNEYPSNATGDATPIATISGQATGISGPSGVAVAPPLVIRTHKLAGAHVARFYRAQLRANLGTTPYRWKVTRGKLPTGLRLRRDGMLSGRPRKRGTYRFTVRVKDASHPTMTETRQLMLQVRKNR